MTPQTVNAVNLPAMNAMNFPAAILQPPYFDPDAAAAMDYGAIGAVIGHEISHSFDDQGALFDAKGRLHNWWTPEDLAHFEASRRAARRRSTTPTSRSPTWRVNGKLTLGENIADVAGLAAAYDAYRLSLRRQAGAGGRRASPATSSSSSASRRAGAAKCREPALRQQILTDGHAPGEYRARHRAQPRRLVRRVRREAGPGAVPRAGGSRAGVVSGAWALGPSHGAWGATSRLLARSLPPASGQPRTPHGLQADCLDGTRHDPRARAARLGHASLLSQSPHSSANPALLSTMRERSDRALAQLLVVHWPVALALATLRGTWVAALVLARSRPGSRCCWPTCDPVPRWRAWP